MLGTRGTVGFFLSQLKMPDDLAVLLPPNYLVGQGEVVPGLRAAAASGHSWPDGIQVGVASWLALSASASFEVFFSPCPVLPDLQYWG